MSETIVPEPSPSGSESEVMVDGGFRLPDWNDLTNEQRAAICDIGWRWTDYHDGGDIAHGIYTEIRKLVTVQMPPLLALLRTDTTQKAAHGTARPSNPTANGDVA